MRIAKKHVAASLVVASLVLGTSTSAAMSVPSRMMLSESLRGSVPALYDALFAKLVEFKKDAVTGAAIVQEAAGAPQSLRDVAGAFGSPASVCFVVRRPG